MTQKQQFFKTVFSKSLLYSSLIGGGFALLIILAFVINAETHPAWSKYWRIRPLILTPLAGAFGGMLFHISGRLLMAIKIPQALAYILSFIGFIIVLWLGIVLGLDGTLWD